MKAGFTPATQYDRGRAEAARCVENQGHRAAQLAVTEQPMLHHPTATSARTFLPRSSAMVSRGMTGWFARRREVAPPASEIFAGLGKLGPPPGTSHATTMLQLPALRAQGPGALPIWAPVAVSRVVRTTKPAAVGAPQAKTQTPPVCLRPEIAAPETAHTLSTERALATG